MIDDLEKHVDRYFDLVLNLHRSYEEKDIDKGRMLSGQIFDLIEENEGLIKHVIINYSQSTLERVRAGYTYVIFWAMKNDGSRNDEGYDQTSFSA